MKEIQVNVHSGDADEPRLFTIREDATIEELLRKITNSEKPEIDLFVGDDERPLGRHEKLCDCGIGHGHHVHCHPKVINYKVDDEPEETVKHRLTAKDIMERAGVNPADHYLIRLKPHGGEESYKDRPETKIPMHEGLRFITASLCPTPVS